MSYLIADATIGFIACGQPGKLEGILPSIGPDTPLVGDRTVRQVYSLFWSNNPRETDSI